MFVSLSGWSPPPNRGRRLLGLEIHPKSFRPLFPHGFAGLLSFHVGRPKSYVAEWFYMRMLPFIVFTCVTPVQPAPGSTESVRGSTQSVPGSTQNYEINHCLFCCVAGRPRAVGGACWGARSFRFHFGFYFAVAFDLSVCIHAGCGPTTYLWARFKCNIAIHIFYISEYPTVSTWQYTVDTR